MDATSTAERHARRTRNVWHAVQAVVWAVGLFIWIALIAWPRLGLHLLWNVLIPVAPALLVLAPGIWRNVCPLGTMSLMPHHLGLSRRKDLSPTWHGRLYAGALVLLLVVVPMRKVILDTNGPLLAAVLGVVGVLAIALGFTFSRKSGWCSSLCPVYPVELLYGSRPLLTVDNAHCPDCARCITRCSDSTAHVTPRSAVQTTLGRSIGTILTGCFPGFIWGWYQVPTYHGTEGFAHLPLAYGLPYLAGAVTLAVYLIIRKTSPGHVDLLGRIFAASAIITYYWFRLPPIFGIGDPAKAMIVDVSPWLPVWSATALRAVAAIGFVWVIVLGVGRRRGWELPLPVIQNSEGVEHAETAVASH